MQISILARQIAIIVAAILAAYLLGTNIADGGVFPVVIILGCAAALVVMTRPRVAVQFAMVCYFLSLTFPGVPEGLNLLYCLGGAMLLGAPLLQMTSGRARSIPLYGWLYILYGIWLSILIFRNGIGLYQFDGENFGGGRYIKSFAVIGFFLYVLNVEIEELTWKRLLKVGAYLFFIPALSAVAVVKYPAVAPYITKVIDLAVDQSQENPTLDNIGSIYAPVVRYMSLTYILIAACPCVLAVSKPLGRRLTFDNVRTLALIGVICGLGMFGGYRSVQIEILLIIGFVLYRDGFFRNTMRNFIAASVLAILVVVIPARFGTMLPTSVQRVISILPWANIQDNVMSDATGTVDWRIALWDLGKIELQNTWMLGKGFGFNAIQSVYARDTLERCAQASSYHNSYLELLVTTGCFGTLLFFGGAFLVLVRHYRLLSRKWNSEFMQRVHLAFFASVGSAVIMLFGIFGEPMTIVPILVGAAVCEGALLTDVRLSRPSGSDPGGSPSQTHSSPA